MEEKEKGRRLAPRGGGRIAAIVAVALAALLAGGYLGVCAYASGDRILPNTWVAGINLGGKTPEEAAAFLDSAARDLYGSMELPIVVGERTVTLSAREAQVEIDVDAAVLAAKRAGEGSFLSAGGRFFSALARETHVDFPKRVGNEAYIQGVFDEVTRAVAQPVEESAWSLDEERSQILLAHGRTGQSVDLDDIYGQVLEALKRGDETPIHAQIVSAPPRELDFEEIVRQVNREAVNATLDKTTVEVVEHQVGLLADAAELRRIFDQTQEGERVSAPVQTIVPQITAAQLRAVLFRDVLGEGSSKVSGTADRQHNVGLAAAACNGVILLPGERMSYNQTTGQRTTSKGYRMATGYTAAGEVPMVGGGVCQPSSTLYLACLNANLEIVDRKNHRFAVSYMPEGMDATVSWPDLDYVFANNTDYPVKVEMTLANRVLTARIHGTKTDDSYVTLESVRVSTDPASTVYRADYNVPQGTTQSVQSAHTGKKVEVYKNLYSGSGALISRTLVNTSTYRKTDKIIAYNPLDGAPGIPAVDANTGWSIDPNTGWPVDPATGVPVDPGTTDPNAPTVTPNVNVPAADPNLPSADPNAVTPPLQPSVEGAPGPVGPVEPPVESQAPEVPVPETPAVTEPAPETPGDPGAPTEPPVPGVGQPPQGIPLG